MHLRDRATLRDSLDVLTACPGFPEPQRGTFAVEWETNHVRDWRLAADNPPRQRDRQWQGTFDRSRANLSTALTNKAPS